MAETLVVYMDGVLCGRLTHSDSGDLRFGYDEQYLARPAPTPLSLSMPVGVARYRKRVVLPFLDGLITDNQSAREAIARRFGVSAGNAFAILRHIGVDVAGALQIVPEGTASSDATGDRGRYRELGNGDVAEQMRSVIEEYRGGRLSADLLGRFSLAGAQPKTALLRTPTGAWAEPLGATPTTHILKPVSGDYRRIDIVEHLTMRAAALLGLSVAHSSLESFEGIPTFVVERYDREYVDGRWRRRHQEDLGQALSVSPVKKYQRLDGGPGVADVARLFRGLGRVVDRGPAAWAFYQGLIFNVVIEGTDAHAKNYSVMLDGTAVQLAPLYDLATYAPYRSADAVTYAAMRIGREYRFNAIGRAECLAAASTLRVDLDRAGDYLSDLRHGVIGAFETARDELIRLDPETSDFARIVVDGVATLPLVCR
ncbi:MAG: HipA domain-containing protein [Gordonia sp. (in: high G+C Gram-positive bacteria)]